MAERAASVATPVTAVLAAPASTEPTRAFRLVPAVMVETERWRAFPDPAVLAERQVRVAPVATRVHSVQQGPVERVVLVAPVEVVLLADLAETVAWVPQRRLVLPVLVAPVVLVASDSRVRQEH
jgi:hypothetical protein